MAPPAARSGVALWFNRWAMVGAREAGRLPRTRPRAAAIVLGLLVLAGWESVAGQSEPYFETLEIVVPAVPGGGWDLTAQAVRDTLEEEGLVSSIRISHSPGAGGLIGLAQFIEGRRGDGATLLIGGLFTVGAEMPNRASVSLLDATPIARLTETGAVIAVPSSSSVMDFDDLAIWFESRPDTLIWAGGSLGGPDQMLLRSLASALGVDPARIHYQPYPGGSEVGASLVSGSANVGISDYSELEQLIDAGHLRALVLSAETRLLNLPVPTLKETGIDISLGNWRAVFAPPDISVEQEQRLIAMFDDMAESPYWKASLRRYHWTNAYLSGDQFELFVRSQYNMARLLPELAVQPARVERDYLLRVIWKRYAWLVILLALLMAFAAVAFWQRYHSRRQVVDLSVALEQAEGAAETQAERLHEALQGRMRHIQEDFDKWGLSPAEKEIALLLLKGLRLQEIADIRATSERTVRQQAQAIYRKSGLDSRTDLAAYFIEDFINPIADEEAGEN